MPEPKKRTEAPKFFIIQFNSTVAITVLLSLMAALVVIQHIVSKWRLISTLHVEKVLNLFKIFASLIKYGTQRLVLCAPPKALDQETR